MSWGVKDLLSLFKFSSIFKEATSFVSASLSASLFESEFSSFISFSSFEESSFEKSAFSFNEISALLVLLEAESVLLESVFFWANDGIRAYAVMQAKATTAIQ